MNATQPVKNDIGRGGGGSGLLVDVFEAPASPVTGSAPAVTSGSEENLLK